MAEHGLRLSLKSHMATEQVLHRFREFLHSRSLRATGLREDIVRVALERGGHFDVDELVLELRSRGVEASRATVYRALPLLLEAGILQPTVGAKDRKRYELAEGREHHDHLVCTACGRVVEVHVPEFEELQRGIAEQHGFVLTGHSHELFGLCGPCREAG